MQQITFLCEQDGQIEKELKANWVNLFKRDIRAASAWLARVQYGDSSEQKVALCVKADGTDNRIFVERASFDFRRLFKTTESLDIIFLSPEQEKQLLVVARPFYLQAAHKM